MDALEPFIFQWSTPTLLAVMTALLMQGAFFGCGKILLRSFPKENLTAFACGSAVFMTLFALLPSHKMLLWGVTLPFALWGAWKSLPLIRKNPLTTLMLLAVFFFTLGSALLPPYSWDEQTYQLALPLRFLQNNSFAPCPDNPYSYYPALTGWFFANVITLGGISLPRILVSAVTPVLLLGVWKMCRPAGISAAWSAAAALFLCPLLLAANRGVYVENFIALFTLGGFFAAWKLRKKGFSAPLVCGLLAGSAFAVKPTGALGALFLFILFFFTLKEWKKSLIFCAAAFLVSFFWYFRTFLYTGNFFYPYSFFPLAGSVEEFHHLMGRARYGLDGGMGAALNWLFAGFDRKLFDGIVTGFQLPFLGVCALGGIYMALKNSPKKKQLFYRSAAALLIPLLCWSVCFPQSRFLLVLVPFAVAGGMWSIAKSSCKKYLFPLLGAVLVCALIFQARPFLYHYIVSWKISDAARKAPAKALGLLTRDGGLYQSFAFLSAATPPDAKCLLLMERRGLYCPRKYKLAVPGFEPSLTPVPENAEKLFEKLSDFDYIIVGQTTQDVDLQSASAEMCEKVFLQLNQLIEWGKLKKLSDSGYPVLQVIKEGK